MIEWKLKEDLNAYHCLLISVNTVLEYIDISVKPEFVNDTDKQEIYNYIRGGHLSGVIKDWDGQR